VPIKGHKRSSKNFGLEVEKETHCKKKVFSQQIEEEEEKKQPNSCNQMVLSPLFLQHEKMYLGLKLLVQVYHTNYKLVPSSQQTENKSL